MSNFQLQQFRTQMIRNYTEKQLILSIFREAWPNLQTDYLLLVPKDGNATFSDLKEYNVKHKKKRVTFTATMEQIDGRDHVFIKPTPEGLLFIISKINKRMKHAARKNNE